jgi:hypothetical protein
VDSSGESSVSVVKESGRYYNWLMVHFFGLFVLGMLVMCFFGLLSENDNERVSSVPALEDGTRTLAAKETN